MNPEYKAQDNIRHYSGTRDPKPLMKLEIKVFSFLDSYHQEELEDTLKACLREYGIYARIKSSTGNKMTVNPPFSEIFLRKYEKC